MNTSSYIRPHFLTRAGLAALCLFLLPGAKNGCGSKESNETLKSPVQAVTTLLEQADGTVDAKLVLISTAVNPHEFVNSAENAVLRVPGGDEVSLSLDGDGHYGASSADDAKLVYSPGETYQFRFELEDSRAKQVSGGNFVAVIDAPDDAVTFEISEMPQFAGDGATITWSPSSRYGLVRVRDDATGELTFSSFDFESSPQFDGSKWARLTKGGTKSLGVDTFPNPGSYTVSFCAVDKVSDFDTDISAELGVLSGFLAGRCVAPQQVTVE